MRLLNTTTLKLEEFFAPSKSYELVRDSDHSSANSDSEDESVISGPPKYAILSHTWEKEEVLFQDIIGDRTKAEDKVGFSKIKHSCQRAADDGYTYIWIDTCCIDKSSSAELSEAINSMYDWYSSADVCYAYMSDVSAVPADEMFTTNFSASRWFTRGWTLQELIAPNTVHFYNSRWGFLGTKMGLMDLISTVTFIDPCVLCGHADMNRFTIARRMLWASRRQTTRPEDMAYCLLGIFGIKMPLLYGEKENAFLRLQTEIMKTSNDQSIFAWSFPNYTTSASAAPYPSFTGGPLAESPAFFRESSSIAQVHIPRLYTPLPLPVGGGVRINVLLQKPKRASDTYFAILHCDVGNIPGLLAGIMLEPIGKTFHDLPEFHRSRNTSILMFANPSSIHHEIIQGFSPNEPQAQLVQVIPGGESEFFKDSLVPQTII
jgi:hypothetical protein